MEDAVRLRQLVGCLMISSFALCSKSFSRSFLAKYEYVVGPITVRHRLVCVFSILTQTQSDPSSYAFNARHDCHLISLFYMLPFSCCGCAVGAPQKVQIVNLDARARKKLEQSIIFRGSVWGMRCLL